MEAQQSSNDKVQVKARAKAKPRRRWLKRGLLAALVALVGGLVTLGLWPKPVALEAAQAERGPMRVTVDEDGVARLKDRYVVSSPLAGSLERIELNPGDRVTAGQVLARLVPIAPPLLDERTRKTASARLGAALAAEAQSQAQLRRASARWEQARDDAARLHTLGARGAAARDVVQQAETAERAAAADLDSLRFGRQIATHEIEIARVTLARLSGGRESQEQLEIRSPVAGRVLKVMQKSEGVVQPGAPLLELGDPDALEIAVDVLTSDAVRIRPGAPVLLERWGGAVLDGVVRRVDPSAFTRISALGVEEQRINVIIDMRSPRAAWAALGDGYRVEARVVVWDAPDVLRVPASAVFRHGAGWAVFRVAGGRAHLAEVELGERTPQAVEVRRGLDAGVSVVVHPSDKVRDGVRVALR